MFLYARLVLDSIEDLSDIEQIRDEASNLPDGLDQAYGRIITGIENELGEGQRKEARTILTWVACSLYPLTESQIKLAVNIANGVDPSKGVLGSILSISKRCGPIMEIYDGNVQFVHFTAKE
jgi:hypothetical protein